MSPTRSTTTHLPEDALLLDYLEGRLPTQQAQVWDEHVAGCSACRELCQQWRQLDQELTQRETTLSPAFTARLWERIEQETAAAPQPIAAEAKARLETELQARWLVERRHLVREQLPGFLDHLGYGAAAAVGGYWLFHLAAQALPAYLQAPQAAVTIGLAAGAAVLLAGLAVVAKARLGRWLAEL